MEEINTEKKEKSIWYNINRLVAYNALFNFTITPRGQGKTYGFKKWAIKDAIYNNKLFVLLRRTDVELIDAVNSFFRDVAKEFPGYGFRTYTSEFQAIEIDPDTGEPYDDAKWITLGYYAYLSNARRKKSVSYEGVTKIMFDEFCIPRDSKSKYLEDEVTIFLDFYETVARLRDVQVFFMGNALTSLNPYFLYFNIHVPRNKKGIRRFGDDIVVEYSSNKEFEKVKKATRFGKLISGTEFERYAVENEFVDENTDGIEKKDNTYKYVYSLIIDNYHFGVYYSPKYGLMHICDDYNPQINRKIIFNKNSKYQADFMRSLKSGTMKYVKEAFMNGCMRYDSAKTQEIVWGMMRKIIR